MREKGNNCMEHTVLLVDDHPVFRKGLQYLLDCEEDIQYYPEQPNRKLWLNLSSSSI